MLIVTSRSQDSHNKAASNADTESTNKIGSETMPEIQERDETRQTVEVEDDGFDNATSETESSAEVQPESITEEPSGTASDGTN